MSTDTVAAIISGLFIFGGTLVGGFALAPDAHAGPFDQKDFPCQEDEALMYAPQFGPNKVGCMHVEYVAPVGTMLGV